MPTTEHEHTLNVGLGDELRALGLKARSEVPQYNNRRIDVEVWIGDVRVAVEAEH